MSQCCQVTTITVGANSRRWLERCFRSLLASDQQDLTLRTYYVDNASDDGSVELVTRLFPTVEVIVNEQNLGFAAANNIAIRRALADGADHIFLVNPDTKCPTTLVSAFASFLRSWPEYAIVGPMQLAYDSPSDGRGYNAWTLDAINNGEGHAFVMDWPAHPSPASPLRGRAPDTLEHAYVQGSALYARADVFAEIGLLDEVFHTYYEEVELCRRARFAGWRVALLTNLGIHHRGEGDTAGSRFRRMLMLRNRYYYLLTDIEWTRVKATRLALRWLKNDVRGQGPGGRSRVPTGVMETIAAGWWLLHHIDVIRDRRQRNRRIRDAARRLDGGGQPPASIL